MMSDEELSAECKSLRKQWESTVSIGQRQPVRCSRYWRDTYAASRAAEQGLQDSRPDLSSAGQTMGTDSSDGATSTAIDPPLGEPSRRVLDHAGLLESDVIDWGTRKP